MSNPVFRHGPITFKAAEEVSKFRFVSLSKDGVKHAGAGDVFGAVTEGAAPAPEKPEANVLRVGVPEHVAVHVEGVVPVECEDASGFEPGKPVYASEGGKAATSGDNPVGVVVGPVTEGAKQIRVLLRIPAVDGDTA